MFAVLPALIVGAACLLAAAPLRAPMLLPPLRTAAVASALVVVFLGLLPEASVALGPVALLVAAGGFALPAVIERARGASSTGWTVAALAAHQVVDGAQIAWLGPEIGVAGAGGVALHGAALSAAAVVALVRQPRRAIGAAAILVGATLLGGALGSVVAATAVAGLEPWLRGLVSGLLLHALLHDVADALPRTSFARAADLAVALVAAGVGALALSGHDHAGHAHAHAHPPAEVLVHAFGHLAVQAAPLLLLALIAASAWAAFRQRSALHTVDTVVREVFPWVLAGLVALALVRITAPAADPWLELVAATGVVIASIARGLAGPTALTAALLLGAIVLPALAPAGLAHEHGPLAWASLGVVGLVLLRSVAQRSLRGWLRPLSDHSHAVPT